MAIGLLAIAAPSFAATCTWSGAGGDARWSNPANWTGCPVPVSGDAVLFPAGSTPLSVNDIPDLTLDAINIVGVADIASYVVTGLGVTVDFVFSRTGVDASGNGPTLAIPMTIRSVVAIPQLVVDVSGAPLTITGAITGSSTSQVAKISDGDLILGSPANAWDWLNVQSGVVRLNVAGALPSNSRVRLRNAPAVLDLNGIDVTIRELVASFPAPSDAPRIRLGSGTLTINGSGTFDGDISGTGGLVKTGPGTLSLGGGVRANPYSGTTSVNEGVLSLVRLPNVQAIGGPVVVNGGLLLVNADEQILDSAPITVNGPGALVLSPFVEETIGSIEGSGPLNLAGGTLTVGANQRSTTFAGTIAGQTAVANLHRLVKIGTGTLTLTGAQTYHGQTILEAGTLLVNGSLAAGDGSPLVVYGGTLGGVGTIAVPLVAFNGGGGTRISPGTSPGILRIAGGSMEGTYVVEINGPTAGSGYDQLDITRDRLSFAAATLQISLGYGPPSGTQFTIVKLPAGPGHAPNGTFTGLPEGAELLLRNQRFGISYRGGCSGNDIVLTALENPPTLSIDDVTVTEGHAGTTDAVFTVTLSRTVSEAISVQYAIATATATAPADYTAQSGTLLFLPGTTTQTITVPVTGDRDVEPDETFLVSLSGLSGAPAAQGIVTIGRAQGVGTIASDDAVRTYALSEGATGSFFDEDILIANPNATTAPVTLTFLKENGEQVIAQRTINAQSHATVHADVIPGLESTAASVRITSESGVPLLVERTMFWDTAHTAGHTASAVEDAAQDWLFGEGSQGFFNTFLLVVNPHDTATGVTFTFLPETGMPVVVARTVGPSTRLTLYAGDIPALVDRSFGIEVHATQPIMAERAMYFGTTSVSPWRGGTVSAGVTRAATHWFLAEGATGAFFDTFILLSNPQDASANVLVPYLLDAGEPVTVARVVPAKGRVTIDLEGETDPRLHNAAVSTVVTADLPIVAERSMYWAAGTWREAHNSLGVVDLGTRWGFAEGRVGGAWHFQTYILLANAQADDAHVTVTYLREEGAPIVRQYIVAARSRFSIDVNGIVPEMHDESFGTLIEVTNGVPIAAERSMYWDAQGLFWSGGTNATGTRLP